jgi:acetyl esterase/lipase/5'-deoxynucleotidase YfbR-like HD superfamily hydrolase
MSFRLVSKPIPDDRRPGVPDPRVLQVWLDAQKNPRPPAQNLEETRASMGWPNLDLSSGVTTEATTLPGRSGPIPIRIYRPSGVGGALPVVVYFHGGGFLGGSLKTVENPCRLLADRARAVVVSVDYRLAPEHPFPTPVEDCWDAVKAVHARAAGLGIDPNRICVAGDSAGGNLSAACCVADNREGKRRIAAQLLIYPVVDLRTEEEGHLPWSEDEYDVKSHGEFIWPSIHGLKNWAPEIRQAYLGTQDACDELASPVVHGAYADFPPTLVVTAEFDFLRVEGEEFARRIAAAGVPVRCVRYRGLDHAFFDKLGLFPQAADVVDEMAAFVGALADGQALAAPLQARLDFLVEIDKLKLVVRRNELADASRRENTAEHSWHLVLFALTLADHAAPGIDLGRVVKLCALHDLVEIDAGDTFFWDAKGYQDKEARERAAAKRLFGMLPGDQATEFEALWEEFEACQTPEAVYANAVDRLAPVLLNSRSGGRSWRENAISGHQVLSKMTVIAEASPDLGRVLEAVVKASVEKGYLLP